MPKPILVIQMQRMGDLILSFPLFLWLERVYPDHPVWVMAEPQFAEPLKRLSPRVRYVSHAHHALVARENFFLVINLSHRPESLALAGLVGAESLVGGHVRDGITRINGTWQEYRASLTHNNRHNRFHWADMNALDVIPLKTMSATQWPMPRVLPSSVRKIGLFLGASETDKRPSAVFWAELAGELERRAWIPVLLGGPGERALCREVRALLKRSVAMACGTLSLEQFTVLGQDLALMITPDTGPMHLAAWSGLKVLNLSMGPVHAWETGPYHSGHVILRSARDCVGCWRCRQERLRCHLSFQPARVVRVMEEMLHGGAKGIAGLRLPGLDILGSDRDGHGLYRLTPISVRARASQAVGAYWHAFWLHAFGLGSPEACRCAAADLDAQYGGLVRSMTRSGVRFIRTVSRDAEVVARDWDMNTPAVRPLSGYAATHLANHDFSTASRKRILELAEIHVSFLSFCQS